MFGSRLVPPSSDLGRNARMNQSSEINWSMEEQQLGVPTEISSVMNQDSIESQSASPGVSEQAATTKEDAAVATTQEDKPDETKQKKSAGERSFRRKRRKVLNRLLRQAEVAPSFLAVLAAEPKEKQPTTAPGSSPIVIEDDSDDDSYQIPPPIVVIDVDAYLGFVGKAEPLSAPSSSTPQPEVPLSAPSATTYLRPRITQTSAAPNNAVVMTPADEGWYEGRKNMVMPEDSTFLGDLHINIRQHLEFFSATEFDVRHSQAGRRTRTVRGKVGIRCIHCAQNLLPKVEAGEKVTWPAGSVTYPLNFSGLYSGVSQKPQLHFEHCPFLPGDSALKIMLQEARALQQGDSPLVNIAKRKRMVQGISALMYYIISCQRIGLQEIADRQGLRFTRDLSLEPLDFESTRMQVEQERPDLIPRQYQNKLAFAAKAAASRRSLAGPDTVGSGPSPVPIQADEASQKVLQEAIADNIAASDRLIRRSDKHLLTDYMFLALSQMAICYATPQDFTTRGKKTKLMRVGLAGFCCRHCRHHNSQYSCRSFSSAADNLASAIANSFVVHLQKCPYTPQATQSALVALKKIHSRQMAQLPYGSQRKVFFEIWSRMRAADQPIQEGEDDTPYTNDTDAMDVDDSASWKATSETSSLEQMDDNVSSTIADESRPNSRGPSFPVSSDKETQEILQRTMEDWDLSVNDHLILPEDRYLVSDYVFLTMRQLKVAMPTDNDFRGNRRNNVLARMSGLCCIHCEKDSVNYIPSGRSFPSAPDNMASALNTSFYNHFQNCPHIEAPLRRAFQHLRKIHSQQCASMVFGSQRKFFNKVFAKLRAIPISGKIAVSDKDIGSRESKRPDSAAILDPAVFQKLWFCEAGTLATPYWQCVRCRMVPFDLRSLGAIHYVRPSVDNLNHHISLCRQDGISLGWMKNAMKEVARTYKIGEKDLVAVLRPLIQFLVGDNQDLVDLYCQCNKPDPKFDSKGLWRLLPTDLESRDIHQRFAVVANTLHLPSTSLSEHPKFRRLLEIMNPNIDLHSQLDASRQVSATATDEPDAELTATAADEPDAGAAATMGPGSELEDLSTSKSSCVEVSTSKETSTDVAIVAETGDSSMQQGEGKEELDALVDI